MSEVSLIKCADYRREEVHEAVGKAVGLLGGIERFVRPGMRVLLKPNMLAGKPPDKAVTTHPEVVRAAARLVKAAGGVPVIGDSNAIGTFRRVAEVSGIAAVANEEGAALVELSEAVKVDGKGTFRHFEVARDALEADAVINLPKAKTHGQMLLTLAVKNLFGCIPGRRKAQWHFKSGVDRAAFAAMLVELHGIVKPALNIVDAVTGMEGNGPGNGAPREIGVIAAGADAFSVDAVMCEVLGVNPERLPTMKVARERGLAPRGISDILLLGDFGNAREARVEKFKLPSESSLEWSIPEPVRKLLKEALTTKPRIDRLRCELCMMCHEACPARAISRGRERLEIDYRQCIRCFCCQEICPIGAIDVVEGWLLKYIG
ncbi:MAG TPA: DUF362 domain-containing protein [Nitrospirota bacterium]|nr:DUF362 domain-containing protein [Nitrospirota bacterium]